jgi:hypothetical protein
MAAKTLIGFRIKSSDDMYVYMSGSGESRHGAMFTQEEKPPVLNRPQALRLLARWLECGYLGRIVRVVQ